MLTVEETRMTLSFLKLFSILNILPIQVDVKSGRIQKQSSKTRVFIWKILFGIGASHWFYIFARFIQSTVVEPEVYFRWDHFVLHFACTSCYAVFYFTGFRLFIKTPEENVIIFNQLFVQPEQLEMNGANYKTGNKNENQGRVVSAWGNEKRVKSGTGFVSSSAGERHEENQMERIGGSKSKSYSEVGPRPRPLLTWPPQYSLDELMAKLLPILALPVGFFALPFLAIDPSRPQLLYSVLPPEWQNVPSFVLLLAVEALSLAIVLFTAIFAVVAQVMFFSKVQLELKRQSLQLGNLEEKFQSRSLGGRENWILMQILEEMQKLVLYVELFNRCFSFCIFPWKIFCLSSCMLYYFFVIRHFEDFPLLGGFVGYMAWIVTLDYTVMYADASSIPRKMDDLKNKFLVTAQKTIVDAEGSKNILAEMKREIKRIHGVGIKVGSFHQIERQSTPKFIDFVFQNVVSLLVTFPR